MSFNYGVYLEPLAVRPGWEPIAIALAALFVIVTLAMAWVDQKVRIIPNRLTYPSALIATAVLPFMWQDPLNHVVSAIVVFLVFFGLASIKRRGQYAMGMGDVKLYTVAALAFGHAVLITILVSSLVSVAAAMVRALRFHTTLHTQLAHGPHIAAGIITTVALGAFA